MQLLGSAWQIDTVQRNEQLVANADAFRRCPRTGHPLGQILAPARQVVLRQPNFRSVMLPQRLSLQNRLIEPGRAQAMAQSS
jgi:hypothetical protein